MKVLLIDADSVIPNIVLMKLSQYYKNKGATVKLIRLNIPYYPNKKKIDHKIKETNNVDLAFCSVIFKDNAKYIWGRNINFGGTGVNLYKTLPDKIENLAPDYSLYPECDISYGFISRGCIRNCFFCCVPKKEGKLRQVNTIDDIVKHKKVKFLDNNFLALPNHKILLRELITKKINCQFNQGLDIRLIDKENSELLNKLNYLGDYTFAFDSIEYKKVIENKLKFLSWRKAFQLKFFVYIHPNMNLSETVLRIKYLKKWQCLPYIMRDISCWDNEYSDFYIDLAAWCNQPNIFKKMNFSSFLKKRHTGKNRQNRIFNSLTLYENSL